MAVDILSRQIASIDKGAYDRERREKEATLAALREEIAELDRRILAAAELNLRPVSYGGRDLNPMALAAVLEVERPAHGWIPDRLDTDGRFEPRFGDAEFRLARELRAKRGADVVYSAAALPVAASLPETASVFAAHAALLRDTEASERIASGDLPYVSLSAPGAAETAREILSSSVALAGWFEEAGASANGWVITAYQLLLEVRAADPAARETLGRLRAEWAAISAEGNLLGLKGIEVAVAPGDAAFDAAVEKLARGGKPLGLFGGAALKE